MIGDVKSRLGPVTEIRETLKGQVRHACGNNEKCQDLYWKAVFLYPKKCEDCDLS